MSTVFIIHGYGGNAEENWFPWLKKEIEKEGHRVIVPNFPDSDTPNLDAWMTHMHAYEDSIDHETIFVGHSLGGMFILRLLETLQKPIKATFLVASVTGPTDGRELAPLMTTFTASPLNIDIIKKNGGSMHLLHADDDPYIELEHAKKLASKLHATITVIEGGKHLGANAGFTRFPLLLSSICTYISSSVSSDFSDSSVSSR